jgi:MFS family permease
VSGFGTWSYNVALAVYAYDRTHSASWVAIVTVGRYLPALVLSWLARSRIDRLPHRTVAMATDLGCAAVMLALALAASLEAPIWLVVVFAAVSSTFARIQAAAVLSLAADVVVESALARAARLTGAAEAVATATGAAAASVLLARFPPESVFLVNAVSFVVSALLIATVRSGQRRPAGQLPPAQPVAGGSRLVGRRSGAPPAGIRVFWPLQAARGVAAYVYGVDIVVLTVIASREFHSGTSGGYGWLLAATGLGGVLAISPMRRNISRNSSGKLLAGFVTYSVPLVLFAFHPPAGLGIAIQVLRGAGSVLVTSAAITALQRAVPSSIAGRVFGTTQAFVMIGMCLGSLSTPLLLGLTGFRTTLVIAALVPTLAGIALLPWLTRFDRREASLLSMFDPRVSVLRDLQLLRDASRSTLYEIADSIVELDVAPGTALVREGEVSDALYVLAAGTVEVTAWSANGPALLRTLTAPDYFGEIGLLRSAARSSTVTASSPCTVWRVPGEVFLSSIAEAGVSGALSDTVRLRFETKPASLQEDAQPADSPRAFGPTRS